MAGPLERFLDAQAGGVHERAARELRAGRKATHWMWFELPQLRGLGRSETARRYGLDGLDEARAYLAHPVLGARLRELVDLVVEAPSADPVAVFGAVDAMKLRSCLTLFQAAAPDEPRFGRALDRCFDGEADPLTLERLGAGS